MPHDRRGPAYNSLSNKSCASGTETGCTTSVSRSSFAATQHAIHATTRLATGTPPAGATTSTATIAARRRIGKAERRLQWIRLTRSTLRRAAFATRTSLALTLALAGCARRTTLALRLAIERSRRARRTLERTLWLATARTTAFAGTRAAAWATLALRTGKLALRLATARRDRERIGVAVAHIDAVAIRLVITGSLARFAALGGASGARITGSRHFLFNPVGGQQVAHGIFIHLFPTATLQATRQDHRTVTGTDQARDGQADCFEHAAHFAVTAFADHHAVPLVDAFAAAISDLRKLCQTIFQLDAGQQFLAHALFQLAQGTHGVLAVDAVARVHQTVGQITGSRKQQQTFSIEVQTTHSHPFARLHGRQTVEHGRTAIRVVMADDLASWLVVHQHAWRLFADTALYQFAIDTHMVGRQDTLANMGWLAIDGHAARNDQIFHVAARTETGFGQYLVQLGRIVVGRQVTAYCRFLYTARAAFFAVESVGSDKREYRIGFIELAWRALAALAFFTALACILAGAGHIVALATDWLAFDAIGRCGGNFHHGGCFGKLGHFARRLAQGAFGLHATHLTRTARLARCRSFVGDGFNRLNSCLDGGAGARRTRRGGCYWCGNGVGSGFSGGGHALGGWLGAGFHGHWRSIGVYGCHSSDGRIGGHIGFAAAFWFGGNICSRAGSAGGCGCGFYLSLGAALGLGDNVVAGGICLGSVRIIHYSFLGCADLAQRQPLVLAQGRECRLHPGAKHRGRHQGLLSLQLQRHCYLHQAVVQRHPLRHSLLYQNFLAGPLPGLPFRSPASR